MAIRVQWRSVGASRANRSEHEAWCASNHMLRDSLIKCQPWNPLTQPVHEWDTFTRVEVRRCRATTKTPEHLASNFVKPFPSTLWNRVPMKGHRFLARFRAAVSENAESTTRAWPAFIGDNFSESVSFNTVQHSTSWPYCLSSIDVPIDAWIIPLS